MILSRNVVVDGQTIFSGEQWHGPSPEEWIFTKPMNWLSEHQIGLRIEKEMRQEHILSQRSQSLGKSGI